MVDLHSALRPLVEQPSAAPRPVSEIAATARRRGRRRRSVAAGALAAVLLVVGGTVASRNDRSQVTTTEQPTTTALPESTTTPTTEPSTTASTASTVPSSTVPSTSTSPTTVAPPPAAGSSGGPPGPVPADERDPFGRIEAETYDAQQGVAVEAGPGDGYHVGAVGDGDHLMFRMDFDEALATRFEAQVASGVGSGAQVVIEARLDDVASPPIATIVVTNTGGWSSFTTLTGDTSAAIGGIHDLYVTFSSSQGGDLLDVDWFRFQP